MKADYKKGVPAFICAYLIWGFQPLYWALCSGMDTMFILANRILWAGVCCTAILAVKGRLGDLREIFSSRYIMKREAPASLFLFADWIIYLIAVRGGRVMECALGYYIMPLVMFAFGAFIFREHVTWKHLAVLAFVITGIVLSTSGFGHVPYVTLALSVCFAVYAAIKKSLSLDSISSTTAEIILMVPLAIVYIMLFCRNETGLGALTFTRLLLMMGSGVVTALPMLFYAIGIENLPLTTSGMFQYLSPTISIVCSLIMGEALTRGKILSFAFIWAGIILYTVITVKDAKRQAS